MNNEKRQYIYSSIGWLNMLVLAPVLFFTIIYNAQEYIYHLRTEQASKILILYGIQICVLLMIFMPAVLLQTKQNRIKKENILFLLAIESILLLLFAGVSTLVLNSQWHIYGGVLLLFFHSYIGVCLFLINCAICFYMIGKKYIQINKMKRTYIYSFLFTCLIISLYILQ